MSAVLGLLQKPRVVSAGCVEEGPPCVPPLGSEQMDVLDLILTACDTRDFLHMPPSLSRAQSLHA